MVNNIVLWIVLAPLLGAVITGLSNKSISRSAAHWLTCSLLAFSSALSFYVLYYLINNDVSQFEFTAYNWLSIGKLNFEVGFLIDRLTVIMMTVVTFVSLMVHIYTIGYMSDDPGYTRFFSYISLFTFMMLMLVMSNNLIQLFFGWEGVGLVSYLLIGFWFKKETAIFANLKAFLVNRVGDLGFILGIAAVYMYFGTFNYQEIFAQVAQFADKNLMIQVLPNIDWSVMTLICICLFIGAMAKSAQVPLHVWLPDSMEGPTPISALIHAATMVTAGVFMVARMSPLFEHSATARSFILVIGATTALFMGILGIIQNDIKRIVAYSTLSQLGYMVVALGASVYSIAIFHLFTHAFFKALLFLSAGSVIIAMHHEQDIWKMGNLKKYMPITYLTSLAGNLALIGFPFFSGFYSKDLIIEAVGALHLPGASYAYFAVLTSVFITALYSFRLFFLVFHTKERMDHHTQEHLHETEAVVTVPLILLAIPSILIGLLTVDSLIFSDALTGFFRQAIVVLPQNNIITNHLAHEYEGWFKMGLSSIFHLPFWLAMSGVATAYLFYVLRPEWSTAVNNKARAVNTVLYNKYGFDLFYEKVIARGFRALSSFTAYKFDMGFIDAVLVNGTANSFVSISAVLKKLQTGYLYNYIFFMILGLLIFIVLMIW